MGQQETLLNILVDVRTEPAARERLEAMPAVRIIDMFREDESEEFSRELPADLLTLYDSLRKTTKGRPVARVERGMCQGCRITLSTMELQRARSAQSGVRCNSCRRIIYLA